MSHKELALLDTQIAAGVFSDNIQKQTPWRKSLLNLLNRQNSKYQLMIPTPVWFELAQWNTGWYKKIEGFRNKLSTSPSIFQYINHSITPNIFYNAALYVNLCAGEHNDEKLDEDKKVKKSISFVDGLIASYCLELGHCLITQNRPDFNKRFFTEIDVEVTPPTPKKEIRKVMYLLRPEVQRWEAAHAKLIKSD